MDYIFHYVEDLAEYFKDEPVIEELIRDVAKLAHDREWAMSGDYGPEQEAASIKAFKDKYFDMDKCSAQAKILARDALTSIRNNCNIILEREISKINTENN